MNRKREEFKPKVEGRVGMYVCGVTAYDLSHIGHARVYITFDVLNSYLRHLGYEVDYARNFTDVDDKVFDKMSREMTDTGFPGAACPDFMWNDITGHIPMEIGDISSLGFLVLNGNKLSGSIPEELGNLSNLRRLQIDENNISGPIPKSFANLSSMRHLHMNNNSISGQIPPELSNIYTLFHL